MWLTPIVGQLNQKSPLVLGTKKSYYDAWPNATHKLGWLPPEARVHTLVLQATKWFADWLTPPSITWQGPNGTQWLHGTNLWPWLPPGWIGHGTLGFPWMQGRWCKEIPMPANYPHLLHHWT